MAQIIKLRRSSTAGKVPTTADLNLGELAINTNDGRIFFEKNDGSAAIKHVITSDSQTTGSIEITGNISGSGTTTGSFGEAIVDGNISIPANNLLMEKIQGTSGNRIMLKNHSTGNMEFQLENSDYDYVFPDGKLGIGTTTPDYGLHLDNRQLVVDYTGIGFGHRDDSNNQFRIFTNISSGHGELYVRENNDANRVLLKGNAVSEFHYGVSGSSTSTGSFGNLQTANDFIVNAAGRVGINTTAPDYKLDVAGNMGVNEYIYHNGDSNTYVRFQNDQVDVSAGGNVFQITSTSLSGSGTSTGSFGRLEVNANTISIGGTELSKTVADNITDLDQALGTDAKPAFSALTASNAIHIGSTSFTISQNGDGDAEIDTDLVVLGDITAQNYIVSSSITHLTQSFSSGSTVFGDTGDDTHQFTGSLFVSNSLAINTNGSRGALDVMGSSAIQGFYVTSGGTAVALPTDIVHSGGGGTFDPQVRNLRMGTATGGPISIYPKHDYMFKLGTAEDNDLLTLSGSNVGIGTISPSGDGLTGAASPALEVEGTYPVIQVSDTDNANYKAVIGTNGGTVYLGGVGSATTTTNIYQGGQIRVKADGTAIYFNDSSGNEKVRIANGGDAIFSGNISGSGASTGSFGHLLVDGQKPLTPRQKAITGTTTTAVDFKDSNNFKVSLTGDVTISSSNEAHSIGSSGMIVLVQDASGGHTVTLPSSFKTPRGDDIAFTSGSNDISIISYYVIDGSNVAVNYMGNFS